MKITKESLTCRTDSELIISETVYANCILDMIHILFIELSKLLENEGRYFGVINSYMNCVQNVFDKIDETTEEDEYDLYGRAMYLYKPVIYKSFRKLRKRRVSKADCIIVIIKFLTDYLQGLNTCAYGKELKTIKKIITKLFDNIKNDGKNQKLTLLNSMLDVFRDSGKIGKYSIDKFSISEEESKYIKAPIEGSGIRINDSSFGKLGEVSWTEE